MAENIPEIEELIEQANEEFKYKFGTSPNKCAYAPGRVNLIGEHTDYNDGYVLPMALQMATLLIGRRTENPLCRIYTCADVDETNYAEFPVPTKSCPLGPGNLHWANYVKGVVAHYHGPVSSFDAVIVSSVPFGGGVSSSASLQVAIYTLMEELNDNQQTEDISKQDKAQSCMEAEHEFIGLPDGIMDQLISFTAMEDHALLLDCRSLEGKHIPMTDTSVTILLTNSNVSHNLIQTEYPLRARQCKDAARILGVDSLRDVLLETVVDRKTDLGDVLYRRAHHVVSEIERTREAARALAARDHTTFGRLMIESHTSLRDDYEVSCSELDELVEAALQVDGVYGSRMTGGGFGGCTVTFVRTDCVDKAIEQMKANYSGNATFYICKPSGGAKGIKL